MPNRSWWIHMNSKCSSMRCSAATSCPPHLLHGKLLGIPEKGYVLHSSCVRSAEAWAQEILPKGMTVSMHPGQWEWERQPESTHSQLCLFPRPVTSADASPGFSWRDDSDNSILQWKHSTTSSQNKRYHLIHLMTLGFPLLRVFEFVQYLSSLIHTCYKVKEIMILKAL